MKLRKKTGMDFFSDNSPKHAVTSLPGRLRHNRSRLQIEGSFACLGTIPNMIKAVFVLDCSQLLALGVLYCVTVCSFITSQVRLEYTTIAVSNDIGLY